MQTTDALLCCIGGPVRRTRSAYTCRPAAEDGSGRRRGGADTQVPGTCAGVDARPSQAFAPVDFAETREFARFRGRVAWRERDSPDHLSLPWVAAAVANGTIGLHLYNSALGLKHAPEKARAFAVELQKLGLCPRVTKRGAAVRVLLDGS